MATLYLHVGPHKTASTYLQYNFVRQIRALQQQGVVYPLAGREHIYGHHNIAFLASNRRMVKTTIEKLKGQIGELANSNVNILLSSEEFSKIPEKSLPELKKLFPKHEMHVIYFARAGSGFISSLWHQVIRRGQDAALHEMDQKNVIKFFRYNPLNHKENAARYKNSLDAKVTILDFDRIRSSGADLLSAINQVMGVELKPIRVTINESMTPPEVELVRAANKYSLAQGKPTSPAPGIACMRFLKIPGLGTTFRRQVGEAFDQLSQKFAARRFLDMGFEAEYFSPADLERVFSHIPDDSLLKHLDQKKFYSWKIIRKLIN